MLEMQVKENEKKKDDSPRPPKKLETDLRNLQRELKQAKEEMAEKDKAIKEL